MQLDFTFVNVLTTWTQNKKTEFCGILILLLQSKNITMMIWLGACKKACKYNYCKLKLISLF